MTVLLRAVFWLLILALCVIWWIGLYTVIAWAVS